ncbi:MAG: sigma-70 family RNA polymerase sigma factor [Verrucomicrobiota bacterium]
MALNPPRSDTDLLHAWSVGRCEEAFRELVEKYLGLVRGVALRRTGNPQLADDIAQAVFVLAARKAGALRASPSLAPWLHHCAWCETTSALRREAARRRHMNAYTAQAHLHSPSAAPPETALHEALPHLDEALGALSGADRHIVLMRFYEGRGLQDIASALGRTEAAVRKQCQRALEKLEQRLKRRGVPVSAAILTAGLSGVLGSAPSAAAAAVTVTRISAAAVLAPAVKGSLAGTLLTSGLMNTKITAALLTAACMSVPLVWQWRLLDSQEKRMALLEAEAEARGRAVDHSPAGTGRVPGRNAVSPNRGTAGPESGLRSGADAESLSAEETEWRSRLDGPDRQAALTDRAQAILGERNPARRLKLFSTFMDELKPGDYEAVNAGFARQDQEGRLFGPEYELFLATAGTIDGEATLNSIFRWYNPRGGTPTGAQQGAMSSWAMEDPDKAIGWWNAQEEGPTKNELAKSLISGLALKDISLAWRCLNEFPEEERAPFMGSLVRQQITDQGADGAAAWLASLRTLDQTDTAPLKQKGFDSLYHSLVNVSPDKKSGFIDRFASEPWMAESHYPSEVAGQWAAKNGNQAVSWAAGLPETFREGALVPAFSAWSQGNPQEFADWRAAHRTDPQFQKPLAIFEEISRAHQSLKGESPQAGPPADAP